MWLKKAGLGREEISVREMEFICRERTGSHEAGLQGGLALYSTCTCPSYVASCGVKGMCLGEYMRTSSVCGISLHSTDIRLWFIFEGLEVGTQCLEVGTRDLEVGARELEVGARGLY